MGFPSEVGRVGVANTQVDWTARGEVAEPAKKPGPHERTTDRGRAHENKFPQMWEIREIGAVHPEIIHPAAPNDPFWGALLRGTAGPVFTGRSRRGSHPGPTPVCCRWGRPPCHDHRRHRSGHRDRERPCRNPGLPSLETCAGRAWLSGRASRSPPRRRGIRPGRLSRAAALRRGRRAPRPARRGCAG